MSESPLIQEPVNPLRLAENKLNTVSRPTSAMTMPIRSILRSGERPPNSVGGGGACRRGVARAGCEPREETLRPRADPLLLLREELRRARVMGMVL